MMIPAKCTQCGANIQVDASKEAGICESCGTAFITEKAINYYNTTNNIHANVVNIYGGYQQDFEIVAGKLVKYHGLATEIVLPDNVLVIGTGSLAECTYLERIVIPKNLKEIEARSFPSRPKAPITICVDSLEQWCSVDITDQLVDTCSLILSVNGQTIHNLVMPTTISTIKNHTFDGFQSIECANLANCNEIGYYAFHNCERLTDVHFGSSTSIINTCAFSGCKGLRSVFLPDSVTSIGYYCFAKCHSLKSVFLSNSLTRIPDYAFSNCFSLQQISIPVQIREIGKQAFYGCKTLTFVDIPNRAKVVIADDAFAFTPYAQNKNGCYVATCVYGSYDCPQVWTLRRFRDNTLAATWYGRAFIRAYYTISPTIVKWFGNTQWFKNLWKNKLDKMVSNLRSNGVEDTPYQDKDWS